MWSGKQCVFFSKSYKHMNNNLSPNLFPWVHRPWSPFHLGTSVPSEGDWGGVSRKDACCQTNCPLEIWELVYIRPVKLISDRLTSWDYGFSVNFFKSVSLKVPLQKEVILKLSAFLKNSSDKSFVTLVIPVFTASPYFMSA